MFNPKTNRIKQLAQRFPQVIEELKNIFKDRTNIYIDFANVLPWQDKLKWHIDLKRLKQFIDSFDNITGVKFYYGELERDTHSQPILTEANRYNYNVNKKLVKILNLSIDVTSIPKNSPIILESFIRKPLLDKLDLETIEYLNEKLKLLNERGIKFIKDKKCNFDVEIGRDMLLDYERNDIDTFILWSGDSDFASPVKQLLDDGKKVIIFSTTRRVSTELAATGARIFEIKKIKEFICWAKKNFLMI